jgi:hypothetical protein
MAAGAASLSLRSRWFQPPDRYKPGAVRLLDPAGGPDVTAAAAQELPPHALKIVLALDPKYQAREAEGAHERQ